MANKIPKSYYRIVTFIYVELILSLLGGFREKMKELLTLPIFALFFLGVATQLVTIAESSSEKALKFTEQMDAAMDCAIRGVNLSICAPDLLNTDFSGEINKTKQILKDIKIKTTS